MENDVDVMCVYISLYKFSLYQIWKYNRKKIAREKRKEYRLRKQDLLVAWKNNKRPLKLIRTKMDHSMRAIFQKILKITIVIVIRQKELASTKNLITFIHKYSLVFYKVMTLSSVCH